MKTTPYLLILCFSLLIPLFATAAEVNCLKCHNELTKKKFEHAAVAMGCPTCHTDIDARTVPHKMKSKIAKGLSAEQPDLCYGCHDKALFEKKFVHAAVGMGCTTCHSPHSSNTAPLLLNPVVALCKTCHEDKASGKHILTGYGLGDRHPTQDKPNPAHPDKELSCVSCHTPHASNGSFLFTDEAVRAGNLCLLCHTRVMVRP